MQTITATIAINESLSGEIYIPDEATDLKIFMPAAWTAATLTFQGAKAMGGDLYDVYGDSNNEITVQAAAGIMIAVDLNKVVLRGIPHLKIRSGTSASAVAQTAARTLTLTFRNGGK